MASRYSRAPRSRKSSLIYVAAEGAVTEKQYFEGVVNKIHSSRVKLEFVDRSSSGDSCPVRVVQYLSDYKKSISTNKDDMFWVVVDADGPHARKLAEAARLVRQKKLKLAVSNPCFEFWLLMHYVSIAEISDSEIELINQDGKKGCSAKIRSVFGSYNHANLDFEYLWRNVHRAIDRSSSIDQDKNEQWPKELGTTVYKVLQSVLEASK